MKDITHIRNKFTRSDGRLNSAAIRNMSEADATVIESLTSNITGTVRMKLLCLLNGIQETPVCLCCGKPVTVIEKQKPIKFCSRSCAAKAASEKRTKNTDYIKATERRMKTMVAKYGVAHNLQREEVKDKLRKPKVNESVHTLLQDRDWLFEQHVTLKRTSVEIAKELDVYYGTVISYINKHGIEYQYNTNSKEETVVEDILRSIGVTYKRNVRNVISPLELDFFIPEHNVAIEVNGMYWHSELAGKGKNYHVNKTNQCESKGITLLQFWDTEITNMFPIVESVIRSKLGATSRIFARKCICKEVDAQTARKFFETTHLQGFVSAERYIGLYSNDILVACMSLSKPRFSKIAEVELVRFSSTLNTTVVGGMSKLLKYAGVNSVVSYANRRWSSAKSYNRIGFVTTNISEPGYHYFNNSYTLFSRHKFQKHKLESILEEFDSGLSEWENMKNNGYNRVWDCGNVVCVWRL